jgi:diketogulonate reductase-like aldo/keto reductase
MKIKKIANIPYIGLGTYKLKTLEEIYHSLDNALKSGYRMFDTAELYKNEHLIGDFLQKKLLEYNLEREDIWITTKVAYFTMLDGENSIYNAIDNSIEIFGYVDLFLIHASNENEIKTWNILREYQKNGKIRQIGVSNYNIERLTKFCETIGSNEIQYIYSNQIEFNPFLNRKALIEMCQWSNIRVIAYGSLYKKNKYIEDLAVKLNKSPEQILLKWAYQKGIIVIPMSRNRDHIVENWDTIGVNNWQLTDDEIRIIDTFDEGYTRYKKHL